MCFFPGKLPPPGGCFFYKNTDFFLAFCVGPCTVVHKSKRKQAEAIGKGSAKNKEKQGKQAKSTETYESVWKTNTSKAKQKQAIDFQKIFNKRLISF